MHKDIPSLALFVIGVVFFGGCSNSSNSVAPTPKGTLSGFVRLYNSYDSLLASSDNVNVSVDGTTLSIVTDSAGRWTIDGVSAGTVTVIYKKQGFGTVEQQGIQFVGGGMDFLGTVPMTQPLTISLALNPLETVSDTDGLDVFFTYNYSGIYGDYGVIGIIAIGNNSDVSAADPTRNRYTQIIRNPTYLNKIYKADLYAAGFRSGDEVYLIANALYLYNAGSGESEEYYSSYVDQTTGRTVYTSLGPPSNLLTLKVP